MKDRLKSLPAEFTLPVPSKPQSEAQRLAELIDTHDYFLDDVLAAAALLRRQEAALRQAREALTHGCPPDCKDGMTDSGGTYPWGAPALIPCPTCATLDTLNELLGEQT